MLAAKFEPFKSGRDIKVQLESELMNAMKNSKYVAKVYDVRP